MTIITNPPLRTIRLYGQLGKQYGRVHRLRLDTNTASEAVTALCSQHAGLDAYLVGSKDRGIGYAVFLGKQNISKDELSHPAGNEDIRIAPVTLGSKSGGIFSIILGVVLVAAAAIATGGVGAAFAASGVWGSVATAGVAMAIGGVVQLLTPMPKGLSAKDRPENTPSYTFNGPINTQAQGNPVPLLYGRLKVGSAVISAGIDTKDTAYAPTAPGAGSGTMGGGGGNVLMGIVRKIVRQ